ncbi:HEAT repeat domain-containing protein [Lysobacter gummosus]|uniref:HEAT repeat domain-containing protein n=1 Tax=Lysobacter TaxID=68 RepID=UPI003CCDFD67
MSRSSRACFPGNWRSSENARASTRWRRRRAPRLCSNWRNATTACWAGKKSTSACARSAPRRCRRCWRACARTRATGARRCCSGASARPRRRSWRPCGGRRANAAKPPRAPGRRVRWRCWATTTGCSPNSNAAPVLRRSKACARRTGIRATAAAAGSITRCWSACSPGRREPWRRRWKSSSPAADTAACAQDIDEALRGLRSGFPFVRRHAAIVLSERGLGARAGERILPALAERIGRDEDPEVRWFSVMGLGDWKSDARPWHAAAEAALADPDPRVRDAARRCLDG